MAKSRLSRIFTAGADISKIDFTMENESRPLLFGNDMSRLLRGLAIILMVTNHCYPGVLIPFAVPLFTFLVGYGYAFARKKNIRHSVSRIWHLLRGFWIILFGICLPVAVFYTHYRFTWFKFVLDMFGIWRGFNFYCWYIYFYIFAMILMPVLSRLIDRFGLTALILLAVGFGAGYLGVDSIDNYAKNMWLDALHRCMQWMSLVLTAYYIASNNLYARIRFRHGVLSGIIAFLVMAGVYMARYFEIVRVADLITVPVFSAAFAALFQSFRMRILPPVLTELGIRSMNIWFLHALFFSYSTRKFFLPVVSWATWPPLRVTAILTASYLMAVIIDYLTKWATILLKRLWNYIQRKWMRKDVVPAAASDVSVKENP